MLSVIIMASRVALPYPLRTALMPVCSIEFNIREDGWFVLTVTIPVSKDILMSDFEIPLWISCSCILLAHDTDVIWTANSSYKIKEI